MAEEKGSKIPLIISVGTIAVLILCWFFIPSFQSISKEGFEIITNGGKKQIRTWIDGFGYWGPFIIMAAMVVQLFLVVVSTVFLMLVAILCYGPVWGSIIALAGLFCASTTGYFLGKLLGGKAADKLMGRKTSEKIHSLISKHGYKAIIIARLTPLTSNDAVSFIAGIVNMNYFKFIGATFLGILPLTVLLAWLGEDWERLKTGLIWASVIALVAFIAYHMFGRVRKKLN
jgi:uncharacterized membrane protein YdjX (TVP38/TMEM64 family)